MKKTLIFTALLACTMPTMAHHIWLEKVDKSDDYVVRFGHEETEPYPEHKLTKTVAVSEQGKLQPLKATFKQGEGHLTLPETTEMVLLAFDNGIWCKLPNGKYVEAPKSKTPTAVSCSKPEKYGKVIIKNSSNINKIQNEPYELVPQAQPEVGKPLAILVLAQGQPAAGIEIGTNEENILTQSNEQGIAYFTPKKGQNQVWAGFSQKTATAEYDKISVEYMLTFEAN